MGKLLKNHVIYDGINHKFNRNVPLSKKEILKWGKDWEKSDPIKFWIHILKSMSKRKKQYKIERYIKWRMNNLPTTFPFNSFPIWLNSGKIKQYLGFITWLFLFYGLIWARLSVYTVYIVQYVLNISQQKMLHLFIYQID